MKFEKGQSGNPGGRKKIPEEIKEMLAGASKEAIELLIATMRNEGINRDLRVKCAQSILDRTYGKPTQQIEGDIDSVLQIVMEEDMRELMG